MVSNRKIAAIPNAISASVALIIRLNVAIAVPPQIQVPPPTRTEVFFVTPIFLPTSIAIAKDRQMLNRIKGRALTPVPIISAKLKVPPVKIMPQFKNCLLQ